MEDVLFVHILPLGEVEVSVTTDCSGTDGSVSNLATKSFISLYAEVTNKSNASGDTIVFMGVGRAL